MWFLSSCLYSAICLICVKEWLFIRTIYHYCLFQSALFVHVLNFVSRSLPLRPKSSFSSHWSIAVLSQRLWRAVQRSSRCTFWASCRPSSSWWVSTWYPPSASWWATRLAAPMSPEPRGTVRRDTSWTQPSSSARGRLDVCGLQVSMTDICSSFRIFTVWSFVKFSSFGCLPVMTVNELTTVYVNFVLYDSSWTYNCFC